MHAREHLESTWCKVDGILATMEDITTRIAWDPEEPANEMQLMLADPQSIDRINEALSYLEALSQATQKEIARQQARQRAIEEAAHQIEREVLTTLDEAKQTTAHGQFCTLHAQRNPPSVRIEDAAQIPAQFMRTPPPPAAMPDKAAIRAAIEADQYVPGAALVRSTRLVRK